MRRDVIELNTFYQGPLGLAARAAVTRQLTAAWGDATGLDVLGLGYATPFLAPFIGRARRVAAAMPGSQGAEIWAPGGLNLACLVEETALPFPSAHFDRVLVAHALEESAEPHGVLEEAARVLAPAGRLIVAAVNRRSLWASAESTPLGHGRPFTRSQLEAHVREAGLEPVAWSRALYTPPWPLFAGHADLIEQAASSLRAPLSGLLLLEAEKRVFAPRARRARARIFSPALHPAPALPATRAPTPSVRTFHHEHSSS